MQAWPFKSLSEFIVSLEWLTDVIRTKGAEQRFSLREVPRRTFNVSHLLSDSEYQAARAIIYGNEYIYVPDWSMAVTINSVAAGASVSVEFSKELNLGVGDAVLLWQSSSVFEICVVESLNSGGGVVLENVAASWSAVKLMPLHQAIALNGFSLSRTPARFNRADIELTILENKDIGATDLTQYRGHDVLTQCPIIGDDTFDERVFWPGEQFNNSIGRVNYLRSRTYPDETFMMRWRYRADDEIQTLLEWLYSRRGRWKCFWLSSFGRDLLLASAISSSDTQLNVFAFPGVSYLGKSEFDLEVKTATQSYYVQVESVAAGSSVNGSATLNLNLSTAFGANVALADVRRVSFLRCVRFNADRIECRFAAAEGMSIAVPCIEVPVP